MVYFPNLGSFSRRRKIEDQLDTIAILFVVKALYHLFRQTVESLLVNKVHRRRVLDIVSQVAQNIQAEGRVVIHDISTHTKRENQVIILRNGLVGLNRIYPGVCSQADEISAAVQDEVEFQYSIPTTPHQTTGDTQAELYDMVDPEVKPLILRELSTLPYDMLEKLGVTDKTLARYISTCRAAINYLREGNIATQPEVWARRMAQHDLTLSGLSWKWLEPSKPIQGYVEFVDCLRHNLTDYIVVLKHQNDVDTPVPLQIPKANNPCCDEDCKTVQNHLKKKWSPCRITAAKRIKYTKGEDVLTQPFDADQFGIRGNNLCVWVE